ncbi:carbohydrate ABC transporter permease [Halocella sp. SP3-1]|uniref:carbohydrate ABC transporter permease n=1 Tax=Halocella sp. SP3-1 TaxID=2382161 RepID=UPI00197ACC30|nr:carbohydrate ABC transporter permease [Halocella sp. SP3-1]
MKKNKNLLIKLILVVLSIYFIFPFYWLIMSTTKNVSQLFQKSLLPGNPSHFVENIKTVFTYEDGVFFKWLGNSFLYASLGAFIAIFIACLVGYAFRRYDFYGKKIIFIVILGFSMVPVYAIILPLFMLFKDLALINTRLAVLLPSFVNVFSVYLMISYWNQVPEEVFSAAQIDGANDILIFFKIGLPNVIPGFITLFLLHFVTTWNNFFLPLVVVNSRAKMPLILGITTITDSQGFPVYNLTLTASFFTILPLLILFISLQKYFKPQLYSAR